MIWRQSYSTRIARLDEPLLLAGHSLEGSRATASDYSLVLGGWDVKSLSEQRLWLRLFRDLELSDDQVRLGLVVDGSGASPAASVSAILPPSLQALFVLWDDPTGSSREALQPDTAARCFAWNPASGLVMVGPATEEAWDEMQDALRQC